MRSIRKTLKELNVFKDLNDSYLEWNIQSEYIEKTVHVIDSVIMQEYFSVIKNILQLFITILIMLISIKLLTLQNFPSKSEIREAYLMNDYSKVSLEELQSSSTFVSKNT